MNRLRASLCALLLSGLVAGTANAATITVTTTDDIVQNDNLCSLREAVAASKRAGHLSSHKSTLATAKDNLKTLDAAIVTLGLNANDTYPNSKLLPMLQSLQTDLQLIQSDLNVVTPVTQDITTQLTAIDTLLNADPNPNPPPPLAPYPPNYDPLQDPYPQYAVDNGITPMIGYLNGASLDGRDAILPIVQRIRELVSDSTTVIQTEIDRLTALDKADGCADGTGLDTIVLDKKSYTLNSELVLDVNITIHGAGDESVIQAPAAGPKGFRLLRVASTTTLSDLMLQNADASTAANVPDQDGGAIMVAKSSSLSLSNVTLQGNKATRGGAIWMQDGGNMTVLTSRFYGNTATQNGGAIGADGGTLSLTNVTLGSLAPSPTGNPNVVPAGNTAAGEGGAMYYTPTLDGSLTLSASSIVANTAVAGSGGVRISSALDGLSISFENITLARNTGTSAALDVTLTGIANVTARLNNLTVTENSGGAAATGGVRVVATTTGTTFVLQNSMVAGNSGGVTATSDEDCDFSGFLPPPYNTVTDAVFLSGFNRNYYGTNSGAPSLCPGNRQTASPLYTNLDLAGNAPAGSVAAGPSGGYLVQPLDVNDGLYIPVFPTAPTEFRLVDRGATTQETFRCATTDQRGNTRISFVDTDCDIGSIEYQVGQRKDDYPTMPYGTALCVDVAANDIGDAQYVPYSLQVLAIERPGAQAFIASTDPNGYLANWVANNPPPAVPPRVVARSTCPNAADFLSGNPTPEVVYFIPAGDFIGETNVTYSLGWQTGTVGTPEKGTVSGIAHMTTEAGGSISSSTLSAAAGPWSLLGTLLLALRRRRAAIRLAVVAAFAMVAVALPHHVISANENVIYVNSGADDIPPIPGDGKCTLREALNTARDDQANLTLGDCLDGNQGPDVIEFTPAVTDVLLKGQLDAYGGVTIRCPTPASSTATQQVCTIKPDPNPPPGTLPFGLINSHGSINLLRMRLANGNAGSSDGGAIFATGGVTITDSTLIDNTAGTGGAVFLAGRVGDLSISGSDFIGNTSTGTTLVPGGGGALAVTAADQHAILIDSSLFTKNSAANTGGAVLVSGTSPSVIVNSTFVENSAANGAGAFDSTTTFGSFTMRNLTVLDNTSAPGSAAITTGGSFSVLTDSIVSSNYDSGGADANCSGNNIQYFNNLFGEKVSGATCPLGVSGNKNQWQLDTAVYDVANAQTAGYLWALIDPTQTTPPYTSFFDPAFATGSNQWPPLAAPSYTPFRNANFLKTQGIIIDQGYVDPTAPNSPSLVYALSPTAPNCATVDQRGFSRASGGICDVGALEWVQTTAVADSGNNITRPDRLVMIDVLANDLYDPANKCVPVKSDYLTRTPGIAQLLDANGNPCATVYYNQIAAYPDYAEFAATVNAATASQPNLKTLAPLGDGTLVPGTFDTSSPFLLVVNTFNHMTVDKTPDVLKYHIYGNDRVASADVGIEVSVDNVPPVLKDDTVVVGPGDSAVIDVLANDSDPDKGVDLWPAPADYPHTPVMTANGLDLATLTIVGSSCSGVGTPPHYTYWQCQFGRVTIDPNTGVLTWVPDNNFNQFSETFQYQVSDYAVVLVPNSNPPKYLPRAHTGTATVTIDVRTPTNGGRLGRGGIGERLGITWLGAAGNLFFLLLGITALRRRRMH